MTSEKPIDAFFIDGETARKATNLLTELGYKPEEFNVSVTANLQTTSVAESREAASADAASETNQDTKAASATGVMAVLGAIIGATISIIGVMLATDGGLVVLVPTAAGGAILGAGIGALFGGLLGSSVPAGDKYFAQPDVQQGRILIHVNPHSLEDSQRIHGEWKTIGGKFGQA